MNSQVLARLVALVLLAGIIPASQTAYAQPGDGLTSADGGWRLTPALTLSGGYNSNVFRSGEAEEMVNPVVDAPVVRIAPGITISNPGAENFLVDFDAGLQWEQFFGGDVVTGDGRTVDPTEQSGLSAKADFAGTLNPNGAVSLTLDENFTRTNFPSNFTGNNTYNWIVNRAGARVGLHPGARILEAEVGYHWWLHNHSSDSLEALDRDEHRVDGTLRWRFLPKTALQAEADYGMIRWDVNNRPPAEGAAGNPDDILNADANPLRLQGGLTGLLTNRIAVRALAGYGWSNHEEGPSFEGIIGTGAIAYTFGRLDLQNTLELGYSRNFRNSTLGNYYSSHTVFADLEAGLWDRFLTMHLGARFELRDYSLNLDGTQGADNNSLNDELLIGLAGLRTNIDDWLFFGLEYNLRANFTEDSYSAPSIDGDQLNFVREYTQHTVTLSTTVQY